MDENQLSIIELTESLLDGKIPSEQWYENYKAISDGPVDLLFFLDESVTELSKIHGQSIGVIYKDVLQGYSDRIKPIAVDSYLKYFLIKNRLETSSLSPTEISDTFDGLKFDIDCMEDLDFRAHVAVKSLRYRLDAVGVSSNEKDLEEIMERSEKVKAIGKIKEASLSKVNDPGVKPKASKKKK